jgi:hypothetical protein
MTQKRIADNESVADLLRLVEGVGTIESLWKEFPLLQKAFPQFNDAWEQLAKLKKQSEILLLPDRFNEIFASSGWIAYESLSVETMKQAIESFEKTGLAEAEDYLANSYDAEVLKWGIIRFNGHAEFKKRIRLVELAKDDYLAERYHSCIPLLLSLLDGLVNDVSRHVGFFAENADLTAWDCIAAHETGLQMLATLMTKGRNKTTDESISIPYRHGILHGRELAFDNRLVAAKTWAALFAVRDWAGALAEGKKNPVPREEKNWSELLQSLLSNQETKRLLDAWKPRARDALLHLPCESLSSLLPEDSPEYAVAAFMENWRQGRFGPLADALSHTYDISMGKKAGEAKSDFGDLKICSFQIIDVEDTAPALSNVFIKMAFEGEHGAFEVDLKVSTVYQDNRGFPMCRLDRSGEWKLHQRSFGSVIY